MESFTDLQAWQSAMRLVKEIYAITNRFPKEEVYGLTSQLRRSSVSILANIAEGFSRSSNADKAYKYTISRGECSETKALMLVSVELGFATNEEFKKAFDEIETTGKLLSGLIKTFS